MDKIRLEPTEYTPGVLFDPDKLEFKMWGKSRPEDLAEFYFPLTEWWQNFINKIESKENHLNVSYITLNISIDYYNSASSKMIYDIIHLGKSLRKSDIDFKVNWHYLEDDEDIFDSALELAKELDMEFNMVKIEI